MRNDSTSCTNVREPRYHAEMIVHENHKTILTDNRDSIGVRYYISYCKRALALDNLILHNNVISSKLLSARRRVTKVVCRFDTN